MPIGTFKYEDCLLKHHIRKNVWLPLCKDRLHRVRQAYTKKNARRLRYFTFCAVGAVDVLMLDLNRVIRRNDGEFDTVVFFDVDEEHVAETQKRIRGAIGFPRDFVKVVLHNDPYETIILEGRTPPDDALAAPQEGDDSLDVRESQRILSHKRKFISRFPFDVINLDLEGYLLKSTDPIPGKLIRCLEKICEWQKRPLPSGQSISEFTLMFTTKLGPADLASDYLNMLSTTLRDNLSIRPALLSNLESRTGTKDIDTLMCEKFGLFFKIAVPKLLSNVFLQEDWYVDSEYGIKVHEFERVPDGDDQKKYTMLHLTMNIIRQNPTKESRAPNTIPGDVKIAYEKVVEELISTSEIVVNEETIDTAMLSGDLEKIKAFRHKLCPECE